jgi:hypothetical protein
MTSLSVARGCAGVVPSIKYNSFNDLLKHCPMFGAMLPNKRAAKLKNWAKCTQWPEMIYTFMAKRY